MLNLFEVGIAVIVIVGMLVTVVSVAVQANITMGIEDFNELD